MSTIEPDDWRLVFMPENQVLSAVGMCEALHNRWFNTHPEKGLMFWQSEKRRKGKLLGASAQCHHNEQTSKIIWEKMYPWATIKFYPLVLVPIEIKDYY